jgi:transcriptional regulator with XRE-family HTH domain
MGMKYFGMRLKIAREANKISQALFAKHLGVLQNSISNWENGVAEPDIKILIKIIRSLNITPEYLFGMDSETDDLFDEICNKRRADIFASGDKEKIEKLRHYMMMVEHGAFLIEVSEKNGKVDKDLDKANQRLNEEVEDFLLTENDKRRIIYKMPTDNDFLNKGGKR